LSITATGGTVTVTGSWRAHQFLDVGSATLAVQKQGYCEILIVAGGGGGGSATWPAPGGGGGGGQVIYLQNYALTVKTYNLNVGAGASQNNCRITFLVFKYYCNRRWEWRF
jgi:hypothetical protein